MQALPGWARWALAIAGTLAAIWTLSATGLLASGGIQKRAPNVTLQAVPGESLSLDRPGKVVVLNFFASWCPPCRDEAPALRTVSNRLAGRSDVMFVGIVYQDDLADAAAFLADYNLTYPAVEDTGGEIARAFNIGGIPRTLVISPEGDVVLSHFGPIRADQLLGAIEEAVGR